MSSGRRSIITFQGKSDDKENASYKIELYKGRNSGAGVERIGNTIGFGSHITKTNPPFSIYVPGLAGVPHFEEYRSTAIVIRKIAGGRNVSMSLTHSADGKLDRVTFTFGQAHTYYEIDFERINHLDWTRYSDAHKVLASEIECAVLDTVRQELLPIFDVLSHKR